MENVTCETKNRNENENAKKPIWFIWIVILIKKTQNATQIKPQNDLN